VSDYGLDDPAIEVRSPAEARGFYSSLCVQTDYGALPACCPMGTGSPFPGVKRGRGVTLTTHPHLVSRSWMSRSYISSPPSVSMACSGTALLLLPPSRLRQPPPCIYSFRYHRTLYITFAVDAVYFNNLWYQYHMNSFLTGRVNTHDLGSLKCLTKLNEIHKCKLRYFKKKKKYFVAYGRSDVTRTIANRTAAVDIAIN
jgi:hypothetical protein